jgi:tetratricopeptide (TPR) repeat protein
MQCPECQFKNPAGAKFCNECGSKLDITCPNCSNLNPAGSKFCNECGHILSKRDVPREATDSFFFKNEFSQAEQYYLEEVYHNLIETTMARGDIAAAEQFYQDLTPLLKLNPGKTAPRFDFLKGRLLTLADSPDYVRADEFFQKSITADETSGAVVLAARTKYYLAKMLARKGEIDRSRSLLDEIQNQFQNWGLPFWQLKCDQALATIEGD